jgi:hypothetical protein
MMMNPGQGMQMGMMNGNLGGGLVGQQIPPGFNQRMPMGQQPTPNALQRNFQQADSFLKANPGVIAQTDHHPFGTNYIPNRQSIPPDLKTWAQLKQWTQSPQNQGVISQQNVLLAQVMQFLENRTRARAQQQFPAGMPGQMPGGQAPTPIPQQPPNMAAMAAQMQVSPQEIQAFRARLPPGQQVTDDMLRRHIISLRIQNAKNQMAHMPQMMPGGGQQMPRPQGMPPQPQPQPQPTQVPQPKALPKTQPPVKAAQTNGQSNVKQGAKRPHEDTESVAPSNTAPLAPAMVPSRSQQGGLNLTTEQMSKLPADQVRTQLLKAQDTSNARPQQPNKALQEIQMKMAAPEARQKFITWSSEEEQKVPRGHPIHLAPDQRARMDNAMRPMLGQLKKTEFAIRAFMTYNLPGPQLEKIAREMLRNRAAVGMNIDMQAGKLKDEVTMSADELQSSIATLLKFVKSVFHKFIPAQNQNATQQNTSQNQPAPGQQQLPSGPPAQLNAANLALVDQQHQQQRLQKPPPAPVSSRPPFPIGGQSPRGAPTYFEGAPQVKDLKLPDAKRRRLGQGASTPVSKASPLAGTGKDISPEKRHQAPPKPVEQKPTFRCREPDCEYSNGGLHTQADLETHVKEAHAIIEDPTQFVLDAYAKCVNVDPKTGQPLRTNGDANPPTAPGPQHMRAGQTPSVGQNAVTPAGQQVGATPMARISTQPGTKSSPSANLLKTPQMGAKAATPSTGAPAKATPVSAAKAVAKETAPAAPSGNFGDFNAGIDLMDVPYDRVFQMGDDFTTLTLPGDDSWVHQDGALGADSSESPDSNSSPKHTPSTRQSDISESDNVLINLTLDDDATMTDVPAAWMNLDNGAMASFDPYLQMDLDALDGKLADLPDITAEEKALFEPQVYEPDDFDRRYLGYT